MESESRWAGSLTKNRKREARATAVSILLRWSSYCGSGFFIQAEFRVYINDVGPCRICTRGVILDSASRF